jgi:hypothetical protein
MKVDLGIPEEKLGCLLYTRVLFGYAQPLLFLTKDRSFVSIDYGKSII